MGFILGMKKNTNLADSLFKMKKNYFEIRTRNLQNGHIV